MKRILGVVAFSLLSSSAVAQSIETMKLASDLGTLIAAEEFCGLSYDQAAIEAYIEKNVPADDLSFASQLNLMIQGSRFEHSSMSASAKTAHCAQIKRSAKSHSFTN